MHISSRSIHSTCKFDVRIDRWSSLLSLYLLRLIHIVDFQYIFPFIRTYMNVLDAKARVYCHRSDSDREKKERKNAAASCAGMGLGIAAGTFSELNFKHKLLWDDFYFHIYNLSNFPKQLLPCKRSEKFHKDCECCTYPQHARRKNQATKEWENHFDKYVNRCRTFPFSLCIAFKAIWMDQKRKEKRRWEF